MSELHHSPKGIVRLAEPSSNMSPISAARLVQRKTCS
jgi:hypothetical protein